MLFFHLFRQVVGVLRWHSRHLALLISSTIRERFQWIARHLDRFHREHPDWTAHQPIPALLLPRNILLSPLEIIRKTKKEKSKSIAYLFVFPSDETLIKHDLWGAVYTSSLSTHLKRFAFQLLASLGSYSQLFPTTIFTRTTTTQQQLKRFQINTSCHQSSHVGT